MTTLLAVAYFLGLTQARPVLALVRDRLRSRWDAAADSYWLPPRSGGWS